MWLNGRKAPLREQKGILGGNGQELKNPFWMDKINLANNNFLQTFKL